MVLLRGEQYQYPGEAVLQGLPFTVKGLQSGSGCAVLVWDAGVAVFGCGASASMMMCAVVQPGAAAHVGCLGGNWNISKHYLLLT